jgi:hypothetical protein
VGVRDKPFLTSNPFAIADTTGRQRLIPPPARRYLDLGRERGTHTFLGARHLGVKPPKAAGLLGPNPTAHLVGVEDNQHGN